MAAVGSNIIAFLAAGARKPADFDYKAPRFQLVCDFLVNVAFAASGTASVAAGLAAFLEAETRTTGTAAEFLAIGTIVAISGLHGTRQAAVAIDISNRQAAEASEDVARRPAP
jgi:hypothetical protein